MNDANDDVWGSVWHADKVCAKANVQCGVMKLMLMMVKAVMRGVR